MALESLKYLVPPAGLEPARPNGQQILSLSRLPISPQGHGADDRPAHRSVNKRGAVPVKNDPVTLIVGLNGLETLTSFGLEGLDRKI